MKTWLVKDENNSVHRHNEFGDAPEWIGNLIQTAEGIPYFYTMGDNRTFDRDEAKQISVWLDEMTD